MTDLINMWHGGKFDESEMIIIKFSRTGKTYNGPGIYTTNDLNTASSYAKGGRSIYYMGLDPNLVLLEKSDLKYEDTVNFVKNSSGLKKKKEILEDLERNKDRVLKFDKDGNPLIGANVLLNLMVNYDVCKGEHGVNLANFYSGKNIDASIMNGENSGEGWVLIFNPKIIKEKKVFSKKELNINWNSWSFDSPFHQIEQIEFKKRMKNVPDSFTIKDLPESLKEDLYNKHLQDVNEKSIKQIFEMKKLDVKTVDLTKIVESNLNYLSSYDVSQQLEKIKNIDNYVGVVSNGKLMSSLKEVSALIKAGIKEFKVIDVSDINKAPEYSINIEFKEKPKNAAKMKKTL